MEDCGHSSLGVSWSQDTGCLSGRARDLEGGPVGVRVLEPPCCDLGQLFPLCGLPSPAV